MQQCSTVLAVYCSGEACVQVGLTLIHCDSHHFRGGLPVGRFSRVSILAYPTSNDQLLSVEKREFLNSSENENENEWSDAGPSFKVAPARVAMATAAGSMQEWLMQSPYVWGRDQTAHVVARRKCRAHRKGASDGGDKAGSSDRAAGDHSFKINNRRYRRWLNDQLLRDLLPPMSAAEIEGLFAPPPWGEQRVVTPLERVVRVGDQGLLDMARWEPFRNVEMDAQAAWIHRAEQSELMKRRSKSSEQPSAMNAWKSVEHSVREALRKNSQSPLLHEFEERLLQYLSESEGRDDDVGLTLETETSYQRLLVHGLTQFHGLLSHTLPAAPTTDDGKTSSSGRTTITIRKKKSAKNDKATEYVSSEKPFNLIEFLRDVQRLSPVAAVA